MDSGESNSARRRWFNVVYGCAMVLAAVLMLMPGGCLFVDFSMWFVNGLAMVAYGVALGVLAHSRRGVAAAAVCGVLGLTHPAWVLLLPRVAPWFGLPASVPFSTQAVSDGQIVLENAWMFVGTGIVFGAGLTLCTLSWRPLAPMSAAIAVIAAFFWLGYRTRLGWPLSGLWPSTLSFPAGILHAAAATGLWLVLRRDAERFDMEQAGTAGSQTPPPLPAQ